MKDVAALCRRVVIIAQGELKYDGSLTGIIDRFSQHKVIDLQFAGTDLPADLDRYGEVFEAQPPRVKLRVPRGDVPRTLNLLLGRYSIEDISVADRPLEEAMAELFIDSSSSAPS